MEKIIRIPAVPTRAATCYELKNIPCPLCKGTGRVKAKGAINFVRGLLGLAVYTNCEFCNCGELISYITVNC